VTRWLIWSTFVILWTIALEMPVHVPETLPGRELILSWRMLIAKSAHVAAFAVLTVLSAWAPMPPHYRWLMMFFLMAYGTGTELMQDALFEWCGRTGLLTDVAFNQLGVLLGAAASWKLWTRPDPPLAA
jgi:VanZ family protein